MKATFFIFLFITSFAVAQTDWSRWEKVEKNYTVGSVSKGGEEDKKTSFLLLLKDSYSFLISDVDGDNCPFYPTCSNFFVESVASTNIFQGALMFADRFTRDSNLFKTHEQYPQHISGRLYDPIENYLLDESLIKYYSRESLVK